nr:uncharacterized protein CTRU02_01094 [Colletotrichum truncatum]KAF6800689.1 hypothetical protein CTRU02_01094 [Colletotrichum truncatum]
MNRGQDIIKPLLYSFIPQNRSGEPRPTLVGRGRFSLQRWKKEESVRSAIIQLRQAKNSISGLDTGFAPALEALWSSPALSHPYRLAA